MRRRLLTAVAFSFTLYASAQNYVHQVYVLNEGYFNWQTQEQQVPVSLGSFDPATGAYQQLMNIEGSRFASDLLVDEQFVYVAADARLLKFSKDDHALIAEADVIGIRKLAIWNDLLLITRGELGGLPHYFEVRNASDLSLVEAITPAEGLPYSIEDVVVADGKAWLGVNNAFDAASMTGLVAVIDLGTLELETTIDLGPNGLNPEKLMVADEALYVLNNTDFTQSSISEIDINAMGLQQTIVIANNSGCGASALAAQQEKVYYMEYAVNTLARYDISSNTVTDTIQNGVSAYGLIDDPINGRMYVTTTDFFSSGELHVMEYDGTIGSSVAVGVSPGHLELDVRSITSVREGKAEQLQIMPNPVTDRVRITGVTKAGAPLRLMDSSGRAIEIDPLPGSGSSIELNVGSLPAGIYAILLNDRTARFVKQ